MGPSKRSFLICHVVVVVVVMVAAAAGSSSVSSRAAAAGREEGEGEEIDPQQARREAIHGHPNGDGSRLGDGGGAPC